MTEIVEQKIVSGCKNPFRTFYIAVMHYGVWLLIQMKQNQNFDHNHSQKVLSCHYNMDTNRVEARFEDGTTLSIDCISIEDEYGNTPAQRAELDWLLYNKPLEYVQLVLSGEIEHYLSLGCDHGILED